MASPSDKAGWFIALVVLSVVLIVLLIALIIVLALRLSSSSSGIHTSGCDMSGVINGDKITFPAQDVEEVRKFSAVSDPEYVSINNVEPGQLRYSSLNVQDILNKLLASGVIAVNDDKNSTYPYRNISNFNNGTAIYPISAALPVVKAPNPAGAPGAFTYVLVDGHHSTISALKTLGATTIPIYVVEDLSTLDCQEFYKTAIAKNYIYPYDLDGKFGCLLPKFKNPETFTQMKDDPNRYFAAISARKCASTSTPNSQSTGADYPLWIKVGADIPFIEFFISTLLNQHGLVYKNEWGNQVPVWFLRQARCILKQNPIDGLCFIDKEIFYNDIQDICAFCSISSSHVVPQVPSDINCTCIV